MNKRLCVLVAFAALFAPSGMANAYDPLPYYSAENQQYNTVSESYITPHLKWAKPYLGGRARVLVVAPRWGLREVVELTQRLDLDATAFAVATTKEMGVGQAYPGSDEVWEGLGYHERNHAFDEISAQDWDAVIVAGLSQRMLPRISATHLFDRIRDEGMGLLVMPEQSFRIVKTVLTHHDPAARDRILKPIPIEDIPVMQEIRRDSMLVVAQFGKGRVAHLRFGGGRRGCFAADATDPVDFEYSLALVARTLMWVTGREPEAEITRVEWKEHVAVSDAAEINFAVEGNNVRGLTPRVDILRPGQHHLSEAVVVENLSSEKTDGGYRCTLPPLSEGAYFFNIRLGAETAQATWYSGAFTVEANAGIDSVSTEREFYRRGEVVRGQVHLRGTPPQGSRVALSLVDGFGRLVERKNLAVDSNPVEFDLALEDVLHNALKIKAELTVDGTVVSGKKREIFAPSRKKQDDYMFVMWGWGSGSGNRVTELINQRMWSDFHVDAVDLGVNENSLRALMRANLRPLPYITRYAYNGGEPTDLAPVRVPSLTDPEWRQKEKEALQKKARLARDFSVVGYTLGDENYVSDYSYRPRGFDVDFHPSSLASFRIFLQEKYSTLKRLNQVWGTEFASWEDVAPILQAEALRSGQYARWIDHRLHMEYVFAEIHQWAGDVIREVDPGARVGFDGTSASNSFHGYDFYQLLQVNQVQNVYDRRDQRELLRSFASKETLTGIWLGAYWAHRSEDQQRHFPWLTLLHGMNSCWYWRLYGDTSYGNVMEALAPDITPSFHFQWALEEIEELKSGIGKLLIHSERLHDGIAVHYSPASLHASSLDQAMSYVPFAQANFASLIEDAGFQYEFVATPQIEEGILASGEYRILVLPCSQVISAKEAQAIRGFAEQGGLVLADVRPGFLDHFGNRAAQGTLDDLFGIGRVEGGRMEPVDLSVAARIEGASTHIFIPDRALDGAITATGGKALVSSQGAPAIVVNRYGKGHGVLFNFDLSDYSGTQMIPVVFPLPMQGNLRERGKDDGLRDLVRSCFRLVDVEPPLFLDTGSGELKATETTLFASGQNRYLGILRNHLVENLDPQKSRIHLPARQHVYDARKGIYYGEIDQVSTEVSPARALIFSLLPYRVEGMELKTARSVSRGERVAVSVSLRTAGGKPGQHVVHLRFRDAEGRERPELRRNIMVRAGKGRASLPLALNDPVGTWTLTARDAATGKMGEAVFRVK